VGHTAGGTASEGKAYYGWFVHGLYRIGSYIKLDIFLTDKIATFKINYSKSLMFRGSDPTVEIPVFHRDKRSGSDDFFDFDRVEKDRYKRINMRKPRRIHNLL
jgi:hypothetical protein